MVLVQEDRLFCVKQEIFLPMAAAHSCDWRTIERNIRTVIHRAWTVNASFLCELAGYPLKTEPTVTEFIEMLASHVMRELGK